MRGSFRTKPNSTLLSSCRTLLHYMLANKPLAFLVAGSSAALVPLHLAEPLLAKRVTDLAFEHQELKPLLLTSTVWALVMVLTTAVTWGSRWSAARLRLDVWRSIRLELFGKLLKLRMKYLDRQPPGYLMARQTDDAENLDGIMLDAVFGALLSLVESAIVLLMILKMSFLLSGVTLLMLALTILSQFMFPLKKIYKEHNEAKAGLTRELHEAISGISLIKCSVMASHALDRFSSKLDAFMQKRYKREWANTTRGSMSGALTALAYPVAIVLGALLIFQNRLSAGELIAFTLFQRRLFANTTPLVNAVPQFILGRVSFERICEVLALPEEPTGNTMLAGSNREVVFDKVSFSYNGTLVLDKVSFVVHTGEVVAIVGESGSGKTTIGKLLQRLYEPDHGTILLGGVPISELELGHLRGLVGYVPQEPYIFNETIEYNIRFGNPGATQADVVRAATIAQAHSFIEEFPEKYQTIVGDRGLNISGGQRQRICLAREILRGQTKVMILDEATSSLDPVSEWRFQQALQETCGHMTFLIIAHKASSVRHANRVLVIDRGQVVEDGRPDDLLVKRGYYYRLYNQSLAS